MAIETIKDNGLSGNRVAKAWVVFDISSGVSVVRDSFNIASITDNGTGDFTLNYIEPMALSDYPIVVSCFAFGGTNMRAQGAIASSSKVDARILIGSSDTGTLGGNVPAVYVVVFGDQ